MLPAPLIALLDHFHASGEPLYLSPIRTEMLGDVPLRMELAHADYAIVPMGSAMHVVSDSPALATHTRELVTMLRPAHVGAIFRLAHGRVRLSEGWASIALATLRST